MGPPHPVTLSDWVRGQREEVLKVRLRWKEAVLVTSALRKVRLQGRVKGKRVGDRPSLLFGGAGDKLTFDELDHFLVGHGGHERAVDLRGVEERIVSGVEEQKDARQARRL